MPEQAATWARNIPGPDCTDKNENCKHWALKGACDTNSCESPPAYQHAFVLDVGNSREGLDLVVGKLCEGLHFSISMLSV